MKTIVAFDTETTGLIKPQVTELSEQPRIIEIYCKKMDEDGKEIDTFHSLLNPGIPLPPIITKITGITDSDLEGAPVFLQIWEDLARFMHGADILTAHNLAFDRNMLGNELMRAEKLCNFPWPIEHICTVRKSKHYEGYRLNLAKLYKYLFNEEFEDAHRASNDVNAQARCFIEMVNRGDIAL